MDHDEQANSTAEVALARLRLFLSPHAGAPSTQSNSRDNGDNSNEAPCHAPSEGEVRPLSSLSREYLRVKYFLQASLPGKKLEDKVMIWDMRNPSLVSQYEQYTAGFLELESWVGVNDLGPENRMQDVYSCGFMSPNAKAVKGMKFTTGNLILDNPSKKGQRQYVLCRIAVGRSYVVDDEASTTRSLPPDYNSFYIRPNAEEKAKGKKGYYHEYVISNSLQILPQYLVQFNYSTLDDDATPICDLCEKRAADVSCKVCEATLCFECDKEVHGANKLVAKHKRINLKSDQDAGNPYLMRSTCSKHDGMAVEFYCQQCSTCVCIHCKMIGDHSCGEKASHRLITISEAYQSVLKEANRPDPLIESRQHVINEKLKTIKERVAEVQENTKLVEQSIQECLQQALDRLQYESEKKLSILRGEGLELRRQIEHIDWAEKYLHQQRRLQDPVRFLDSWQQHKVLRAELRDFPVMHVQSAENMRADIQLVGNLQVISGEEEDCEMEEPATNNSNTNISNNNSEHRTERITSNLLSPKSTQLIAKVKNELARGNGTATFSASRTMHFNKTKLAKQRRPSASGIDNLSNNNPPPKPVSKEKEDAWTKQLRVEMNQQQ